MEREEKKAFVENLHSRLEKSEGIFLVDYKGLDVEALNRLRTELRGVNAQFQIVKNRLLKLACENTDTEMLKEYMQGPSAIALSSEDVVGSAKILVNFAKDFEKIQFKGGVISGRVVDKNLIERFAELPGRDVLLAQALSAMQAVPASLVRVLNGVLTQLLYVLKAIEQQKQTQE
jgi:large subunit ribosomal protein L10